MMSLGNCEKLVVLAVLGLLGCSRSELPLVPVYGKVTFAGGPCPKPGSIAFAPQSSEGTAGKRPGTARFAEDGNYEASSFKPGDGLLPGKYVAVIECWERPPEQPGDYEKLNLVPRDYRPEFVVGGDASSVEANFDVPKKK